MSGARSGTFGVGPDVFGVDPGTSGGRDASGGPDAFACITDHAGHCITCSDEGVPMTVITLDRASGLATCEDGAGMRCTIDLGLIDDVTPGAVLLTHAGTAIAMLAGDGRSGAGA